MKRLQSQLLCMKNREVTVDLIDLFPSSVYPNAPEYGYHDFYELEVYLSGRGVHELNAVPYRVTRGYAYLLLPGDFHRYEMDADEKMIMYNLKIAKRRMPSRLVERLSACRHPYAAYFDEAVLLQTVSELSLLSQLLKERPVDGGLCDNVIERILLLLCRELATPSLSRERVPVTAGVEKVISYMEAHYHERITGQMLAEQLGLSTNYFGTYFKTHTGMTPVDYLTRVRLSHAARMLKSTREKIKTIAHETGFRSPEYFTRVFRDAFGVTPAQYRESLQ